MIQLVKKFTGYFIERKAMSMFQTIPHMECSTVTSADNGIPMRDMPQSIGKNDLVKKTLTVSSLSRKGTKKNKKIHNTKVRTAVKKYIKDNK